MGKFSHKDIIYIKRAIHVFMGKCFYSLIPFKNYYLHG